MVTVDIEASWPSLLPPQIAESATAKRKPGRPKVYIESEPPSATERSNQSVKALKAAGGKRVMLRLTPEAREALKIIMESIGSTQETATINQIIVARKNEILWASAKNT